MTSTLEHLGRISLFSKLSESDLKDLVKYTKKRAYPKDNVVLHKGEEGNDIFLIISGNVKVVITNEEGKDIVLSRLKEGNCFGEMSIFDGKKRSASVVTESYSEFLIISRDNLSAQIFDKPNIAWELLKEMTRRLRISDEKIRNLTLHNLKLKVINLLTILRNDSEEQTSEGFKIIDRPPMENIATLCGTFPETVDFILKDFHEKGIIKMGKEKIIIQKLDTKELT